MGLEYESVVVTPEVAEEWLETMGVNRKISESNLEAIALAMTEDRWHNDGTPIRFNTEGHMIDGQHRCMAISMTGKTQTLMVVRGVKPEAMTTIDTGKSRNRVDVLSIHDPELTNVHAVAGVATVIQRWKKGARGTYLRNLYVSNDEFIQHFDSDKEAIITATKRAGTVVRQVNMVTTQTVALCTYLFEKIDHEDAEYFWDRLIDGIGLEKGDPILALRNLLQRQQWGGLNRLRADIGSALIMKAWNAYREGRKIELLAFKVGGARPERYPEPV